MRGQAMLEFLFAAGLALVLLVIATMIYVSNLEEASALHNSLEAGRICMQVSSTIESAASLPGTANSTLSLPPTLNGFNYTVYLSAQNNVVKVDYVAANRSYGQGCSLAEMSIANSTGSGFFEVKKNASISANGGSVVVSP